MATDRQRKVLVLGGSRGIGAAIVRRFAAARDTVAFTYMGSEAAAQKLANEVGAEAIKADSADRQAVIDVVKSRGALVLAEYGTRTASARSTCWW